MLVSGGDIFAYVLGDMYITPNFPRFRCCLFWQQNISNETEVAPHQHIVLILFAKNKTRWAVLYLGVLTTAFTNWLQTIGQQLEVEKPDKMWRISTELQQLDGAGVGAIILGSSFQQIVNLSWSFDGAKQEIYWNIILWFFYIIYMNHTYIYIFACLLYCYTQA